MHPLVVDIQETIHGLSYKILHTQHHIQCSFGFSPELDDHHPATDSFICLTCRGKREQVPYRSTAEHHFAAGCPRVVNWTKSKGLPMVNSHEQKAECPNTHNSSNSAWKKAGFLYTQNMSCHIVTALSTKYLHFPARTVCYDTC